MVYFRLQGLYREDKGKLIKVKDNPGNNPLHQAYKIAAPHAVPERKVYCREAGDERIRQRIYAADAAEDLIIIKALIEKGALRLA